MNYYHSVLDLLCFSWSLENGSTHHKTTIHKLPSVADFHIPLEELITGKPFNHKKWPTFMDLRQCIKWKNWELFFLGGGSMNHYVL